MASSRRPKFIKNSSKIELSVCQRRINAHGFSKKRESLVVPAIVPNLSAAWWRSGNVRGRDDEALPLLAEAVRIDPSLADAQFNLATVLMNLGRLEEAIPHLEALVKSLPRKTEAHIKSRLRVFQIAQVAGSRRLLCKSRGSGAPKSATALQPCQHFVARIKDGPAMVEFSTAVRLDPGYVIATLKLAPNDPALRYYIGTILLTPISR